MSSRIQVSWSPRNPGSSSWTLKNILRCWQSMHDFSSKVLLDHGSLQKSYSYNYLSNLTETILFSIARNRHQSGCRIFDIRSAIRRMLNIRHPKLASSDVGFLTLDQPFVECWMFGRIRKDWYFLSCFQGTKRLIRMSNVVSWTNWM